ncbi:MAG TPA: hypothetical protein VGP36_17935 [Mycobacteriales bacterium]|nr:hypothetical protein [Mycobacteriales bacterium]
MTNPAPMGGDERPRLDVDPPTVDLTLPADPVAPPLEPTPAYDSLTEETAQEPVWEPTQETAQEPVWEPTQETARGSAWEPAQEPAWEPTRETVLAPEADYALAPDPGGSGPLAQVKAFAADKPAVFLGIALATGWLVGKLLSSDDDD